jgi:outer membrane protein, heavy metal efflux system
MKQTAGVAIVVGLIGLVATQVCAQPAPSAAASPPTRPSDALDLAQVLRLARDASPRLAIQRESIHAAEANRITAGAYPNPTISFGRSRPQGGQATLFTGSRQDQASLDVPLLIAGQRPARIERADREIEAARARVEAGASSLAGEAGAAFVALLAAQEKAALLAQASQDLARLRDIVAGRASLGVASRYDETRLEVELGGVTTRADEARADISDRAGTLGALLGLPSLHPLAVGALSPLRLDAALLETPRDRVPSSPTVTAAVEEEKAAQSGIEVAQRERWPVPSVSVGRSWTADPFGAANFLGVSVEVAIFDTRRGPVARAESEAAAARLRRELAQAEVAIALERYSAVIAARQAALQRFDREASSRLSQLKDMSENAYRLGRSSIFELLDSTRSRYELQQSRIDLVASLLEAQVRYLATSGSLERVVSAGSAPRLR